VESRRCETKADVHQIASKYPGALAAYWLAAIYSKVTRGESVRSTKDLRRTNAFAWSTTFSGLSDLRDQREVQTLCLAIDHVNKDQMAEALDTMAQRVVAIQAAKRKGGTWEKAEAAELLPGTGSAVVPGGMLSLV